MNGLCVRKVKEVDDLSRIIKYTLLLILLAAVLGFGWFIIDRFVLDDSKTVHAGSGNAEWDETVDEPDDPSGGLIDDDTFTILEIVPHKSLGAFGYLVGGEEPIDTSLLSTNLGTTRGEFSTLGDAVSFYNSYIEEELAPGGTVRNGWYKEKTVIYQNGYFEWVGWSNGSYNTTGSSYVYTGPGQGNYKAVLDKDITNYTSSDANNPPVNRKNVIAYFVAGKPEGVELYNDTLRYRPLYVNKNTGLGDYDYNCEAKTFILDKGHGDYDVIFEQSTESDAVYYLLSEDFEVVNDNTGTYSWSFTYQPVGEDEGDFDQINIGFQYQNGGPFRWVQDNSVTDTPRVTYNPDESWHIDRAYISGQELVVDAYQYTRSVTMINNEWFKRYILGIPYDNIKNSIVNVVTMTPEELNALDNTDIIKKADLFYISEDLQNGNYDDWYKKYNPEGKNDVDYSSRDHVFMKHDLNWACTEEVFKRIAGVGGRRAAVIISYSIYRNARVKTLPYSNYYALQSINNDVTRDTNSTICNVAKLYLILMQRDIVGFYNAFMNPYNTSPYKISSVTVPTSQNPSGTTGSFVRPDQIPNDLSEEQFRSQYEAAKNKDIAIYWNMLTFMPYEYKEDTNTLGIIDETLKEEFPNMNILRDPSDLHENVITMDGSEYVNKNLITKTIDDEKGSDEYNAALINVNSVNDTYKSSLNIADVINYITDNGQGYQSNGGGTPIAGETGTDGEEGSNLRNYVSVLNIQPTADFNSSNTKIRDILKNYTVQIDEMTTTQFNSNVKDINTHYDIIYMGAGNGRFNLDSSQRTVFNDSNMTNNHYIFFGEGDRIATSEGNSRYYGNDLTAEKTEKIKGFLRAGFTMILDPVLYNLSTSINASSNVYQLINEVKSNGSMFTNVLNSADYDNKSNTIKYYTFLANILRGLMITRPKINLISPTIEENAELGYFYPENGNLIIHFKLEPWGILPSSYRYNAYLYLDMNGDGLYDEDEQINVIDNAGNRPWESITESRLRNYYFNLDMKQEELKLNGVYQWKIKVVRSDKPDIRSEVTGYAAYSEVEEIKVLQIIDNPHTGVSDYSLKDKISDEGSLIHDYCELSGLDAGNYYNFIFDTLTVDEYEALFDLGQPYTTAARASTDRLSGYHILILDNQTDNITNSHGALQNIKDEIDENIGVIFTKGAVNYNKQSAYLKSERELFQNRYTYNRLNRISNSGQLYIYSNLSANGNLRTDNTYKTGYLTRSNNGTIAEFPYKIGNKLSISPGSYSESLAVEYDRAPVTLQPLIGWYCLSDTKSPVINSAVTNNEIYQGMYSSSPNDVNNNYYLMNRGNIFYSGIVLNNADNSAYSNEVRLFINTIFAAYQYSRRMISSPAKITFIKPAPVVEEDLTKSVTVSEEYISGTDFILTFTISQSSSDMNLSILLDGEEPSGNWSNYIYKVTDDVIGDAIAINNTNNAIMNGTYALKIPLSALTDDEGISVDKVLSLTAVNKQSNTTTEQILIKNKQAPVVTIEDPVPITHDDRAYIYADIDYNALDITEDYLDSAEDIRIVFKVDKAGSFNLEITSEGENLIDEDGYRTVIYPLALDNVTEADLSVALPKGEYVMYIPVGLMKAHSSRELTIRAIGPGGASGEASVILLRRNLFPLD
jgi:hypothetical protein